MIIREANINDYEAVWNIFQAVIQTGDTYVFPPNTPKEDLEKYWFAPYMQTFVLENEGIILGTYILKPNQIGFGSHIANASYMVNPKTQGKGIGKKLCAHSIQTAKLNGYQAMQFNLVVSTNIGAIKLWQKYGFKIIGTIPNGFQHQQVGFVDAYIMYRGL